MKHEVQFWNRIVEGLWRPDRVLNRVENGVVDGMPDAYFTIRGVSGWMELKCPETPSRPTTALFSGSHQLSLAQRNWLLAHRQAGGRAWVAIETERCVMLLGAKYADDINSMPLSQLIVASSAWWTRPMNPISWEGFAVCLRGVQP